MANFTLGTRGSLLAVTQSTLIKNQLESFFPEHSFNLLTIKTQGDEITDKPLWQIDGKDFFTKELDDALLKNQVDLVVHSYKDLSLTRPSGIKLAAITKRSFAHDVFLIHRDNLNKLYSKSLTKFKIGTSSPRRHTLMAKNIQNFLPFGENLNIEFDNLRGNINTRIQKLLDNNYHAICLAAAGLERLAALPHSRAQLAELLKNIEIKFLPLSEFPCAPAQGALAIECLDNNSLMLKILSKLNDETTAQEIHRERKIFQSYGGGCHLSLGVFSKNFSNSDFTTIAKGELDSKKIDINQTNGKSIRDYLELIKKSPAIFLGLSKERAQELNLPSTFLADELSIKETSKNIAPLPKETKALYYLTSEHTLAAYKKHYQQQHVLWASGTQLHQKMAKQGYWVMGDNDSLGNSMLQHFLTSYLGQLILEKMPTVQLSFTSQTSPLNFNWGTYEKKYISATSDYLEKLKKCQIFFWTSHGQYMYYQENFPFINRSDVTHFCGVGKTYIALQKILPQIIPVSHISEFIKINN